MTKAQEKVESNVYVLLNESGNKTQTPNEEPFIGSLDRIMIYLFNIWLSEDCRLNVQ